MKNFSNVHSLHVFVTGLYAGALPRISQVMVKGMLESFRFQIYFESEVSFGVPWLFGVPPLDFAHHLIIKSYKTA